MAPRPALASVLAIFGGVAGFAIGVPAGFLLPIAILGASSAFFVFLAGLVLYRRPNEHTVWGLAILLFALVGVAASVLCILTGLSLGWQLAVLSGLLGLSGMGLAILGGIIGLLWRGSTPLPPPAADP